MADSQSSNISAPKQRTSSMSQASESSQTAAEFIKEQLSLEAEAREALPYQFDTCTRDLGAIRQSLFSCLTCNPPPATSSDSYSPAGVCYSCSISCHGEHTLVELFGKRKFVCDCGTTRIPETAPCTLRVNSTTGQKGDVTAEEPAEANKYNQNFRNIFCGCCEEYDPHTERGTMFQCLGLGTVEDGGCGEDWWHPECVVGFSREEYKASIEKLKVKDADGTPKKVPNGIKKEVSVTRSEEEVNGHAEHAEGRRPSVVTAIAAGLANGSGVDGNDIAADAEEEEDDPPLPPGFPQEYDFDAFICYKCLEAHPWIKTYAGTEGFLPPVYCDAAFNVSKVTEAIASPKEASNGTNGESRKRKASDDQDNAITSTGSMAPPKRQKSEDPMSTLNSIPESTSLPITPKKQEFSRCKFDALLTTPGLSTKFSLFLKPDFRDHLCHCPAHYPFLKPHPQLLEEEDTYEPPVSESEHNADGSVGTGSIYDKGEAAFSTMDRMQAIQGAMAYAHLKDGLKAFLQPFAESGQAVGAEDIKAYFEKLRGDAEGIKEAKQNAEEGSEGGDNRREQSGY